MISSASCVRTRRSSSCALRRRRRHLIRRFPSAIISIGTNSTRGLVADLSSEHPAIVYAESIGTRIGKGLREKGALNPDAIQRTLDAIREHLEAIAKFQPQSIAAIATSALRRASDANAFAKKVASLVHAPLTILSGEEEAIASYRGAITALDGSVSVSVVDIGGGSTEYASGHGSIPDGVVSCEVGAVRLTEAFPMLAGNRGPVDSQTVTRARSTARALLTPITKFPRSDSLVVVGGSASTAVGLIQQNTERFDSMQITRDALDEQLEKLLRCDLEHRKQLPGMKPQRVDILPAGLLILQTILDTTAHSQITVTTRDLLLGYLLIHEGKKQT